MALSDRGNFLLNLKGHFMKKLVLKTAFVALSALFAFNSTATAADPALGKEYLEIRQAPSAQKEVVEFFSFYCPHCYNFEMNFKIPSQVKAGLPEGTAFKQYHVSFDEKTDRLARAWALAMALKVEEKVKTPLFEAAQANKIDSMNDVRDIFAKNGVTAEQFDANINSFVVSGLYNKQTQLAEEYKVVAVPSFFVNGQYQLNMEGFSDAKSNEDFIKRYVDAVLFLSKK